MKFRHVWWSLLACAAACAPDPDEAFDHFGRRVEARATNAADASDGVASDSGPNMPCEPASAGDLAGIYIFTVVPTFATNVVILSRVTIEPVSDDEQQAKVSLQSLTQAEPHVPVGDVTKGTLTIHNGQFQMETVSFTVPAAANPAGFEGRSTLSFHGASCAPSTGELVGFCGTADGMVLAPLMADYTGSTFAALRSQDGQTFPKPVGSCDALESNQ